jgi:hypothetical protein
MKHYRLKFQYQIYSNSSRRATQYSSSSSGSNSGRSGVHDFPHQLVPGILCPPPGYQTMPSPAKHVVVTQVSFLQRQFGNKNLKGFEEYFFFFFLCVIYNRSLSSPLKLNKLHSKFNLPSFLSKQLRQRRLLLNNNMPCPCPW